MTDLSGATIVFDLDGTLVDTAPDLIDATYHALTSFDLPTPAPDTIAPWISYGARRMIVEALVATKNPKDDATVDAMNARFLEYYEDNIANKSKPFPHIVDAITQLKAQGAKISVCTNKREKLSHRLLDALSMSPLFDAIAGRDTFATYKPHPDHLTGAITLAKGAPNRAVMIGDSHVDIETAKAANVRSIGVTFGYSQIPIRETSPDIVLESYEHLLPAVRKLLQR